MKFANRLHQADLSLRAYLALVLVIMAVGGGFAQEVGMNSPTDHLVLKKLNEIKQQEGKDNALIYYTKACLQFHLPNPQQAAMLDHVLKNGWIPQANQLAPYFSKLKWVLKDVEKGVLQPYARGTGFDQGLGEPTPNYLALDLIGKALCAEAVGQNAAGDRDAAILSLLYAMKFGNDLMSKDSPRLSWTLGHKIVNTSVDLFQRMVRDGNLTPAQLTTIVGGLDSIISLRVPIENVIEFEKGYYLTAIELAKTSPTTANGAIRQAFAASDDQDFANKTAQYVELLGQCTDLSLAHFKKPYGNRNDAKYEKQLASIVAKGSSALQQTATSYRELDVKLLVTDTKLSLLKAEIGLANYYSESESYPDSLADLVPAYMKAIPVGAFDGKEPYYKAKGLGYVLRMVGPDRRFVTPNALVYDISQGIDAPGNITFD